MADSQKIWLVRTRSGELLGPFDQANLITELKAGNFTAEDEIAANGQDWISAHTLAARELDEFTLTATRSVVTKTASTDGEEAPAAVYQLDEEEMTPTPTPTPTQTTGEHRLVPPPPLPPQTKPAPSVPRLSLQSKIVLATLSFAAVWTAILLLNRTPPQAPSPADWAGGGRASLQTENPFVKEMYQLILAGKPKDALKRLIQYHQEHSGTEQEYKIPYAALLITERESITRARTLLEEVLEADVNARIKMLAHRWLGYLMLSEEEGDMGTGHFQDALEINPKDPASRFNLGRAYLKQKKYQLALEGLRFAETELDTADLWLVQIYKGRTKAALGLMEEARVAFRTAVELAPDRWLTYIYYALFLKAINHNTEAQKVMDQMLTRDPHYEVNTPTPFGFYQEPINYAEYLESFSEVMADAPITDQELGRLYIGYLLNGPQSNESKRITKRAKTGDLRWKIIALKVWLDATGKKKEIQGLTDHLPINLAQFGYYAHVLRGEAWVRLGEIKKAQQDFERALLLEPKTAVSRLAYAILLRQTERQGEAKSEIINLLSYHPHYIPAIVTRQKF